MPATDAPQTAADAIPQRHGIYMPARGTFVAAGLDRDISRMPNPDIRFGIGLWPSEAMAYIEPDDAFTNAAVRLRQLGPKLGRRSARHASAARRPEKPHRRRDRGRNLPKSWSNKPRSTSTWSPSTSPICSTTSQPSCRSATARPALPCEGARGSLRRSVPGSARRYRSRLGRDRVRPRERSPVGPRPWPPRRSEPLPTSPHSHWRTTQNIYIITNHPNFERADPDQKLEALKASARQTIAAAEAIDASMLGMFRWLDKLLDHLINVVCQRLPEGDRLRERWASDEWTVIQRLTFFDTDAALAITRAFPAISDGPLLPGTESE